MALTDGTPVDARPEEPRIRDAHAGRRFRTTAALAAHYERVLARGAEVLAALRENPPADESRDLDRATTGVEGVLRAVNRLDGALGWREGA